MPVQLVTVSEYARHRGCDEKAVRKAIEADRITTVERDGKRLIDPEVADIQWERNTRARVRPNAPPAPPAAESPPAASSPPPAGPDYNVEKALEAKADRELKQIAAARAAGRVLDRERAERAAFESFRELRDATFSACKSQARRVQGLVELREIELALEEELRAAYAGWEDRMRARLQEAAQP
jgi:hypothetical protein